VRGDLVAVIPHRFFDALESGEITDRQFLLGAWFIKTANFKTKQVALTLRSVAAGHAWRPSDDTVRRDLEVLKPDWLDFEMRSGQRRTAFRLTGLCQTGQQPPHDLRKTEPHLRRLPPDLRRSDQPATPQPERGPAPEEPPTCGGLEVTKNYNTSFPLREIAAQPPPKTSGSSALSEGGFEEWYAQAIARLGAKPGNEEQTAAPEGSSRNGIRPPRVEKSLLDGSLLWSGEPVEGEAGVLADLDALAAAGLGEWHEEP
jgi:hypothetical protein